MKQATNMATKTEFTEKDYKNIKEALTVLLASYERQLNSKNNELIKETYGVMKRELEATIQKL